MLPRFRTGGSVLGRRYALPARVATLALLFGLVVALLPAQPWWIDVTSWSVLEAQVPGAALQPLEWVTRPPRVVEMTYASALPDNADMLVADLYMPVGRATVPGILLLNGVEPRGRKLPEFVHLADALARAGYAVLAPDIPGLLHERVRPADVGSVVASFQALTQARGVDGSRAGMIGFSIGASLELLAAADPRISHQTRFVADVGGYAKLVDILQAATTHTIPSGDGVVSFHPNPYVWYVGRNTLVGLLPDPHDQEAIMRLFPDPDAPSDAGGGDVAALSPDGKVLFDLLENRDPAAVQGVLSHFSPPIQASLDALSPERHAAAIQAQVRILHDQGDPYIPVQQSRVLASLPELKGRVSLLELSVLQHVELAPPDLNPRELLGFYVPQMARLNGYLRDTLRLLRS